jgi:hypothetical protein
MKFPCIYDNKRITVAEYLEKPEVKRFEAKLHDCAKECACFRDGICAFSDEQCKVLNEGFPTHTSRRCTYFERMVLPANERLYAEYWTVAQGGKLQTVAERQCVKCGVYIEMTSPRRKYCDGCKSLAERDAGRFRKQRERARKQGKCHGFETSETA